MKDTCHCAQCEASRRAAETERRLTDIEGKLNRLVGEQVADVRAAERLALKDKIHFSDDGQSYTWQITTSGWRKKEVRTNVLYGPTFSYAEVQSQNGGPSPPLTPLMLTLLFHRATTSTTYVPLYRRLATEQALRKLVDLGLVVADFPSCHYDLTARGIEYVRRVQSVGLTI